MKKRQIWDIESLQKYSNEHYGIGKYTVLRRYKDEKGGYKIELKCSRGHVFSVQISHFIAGNGHFKCKECDLFERRLDFLYWIITNRFEDFECLNPRDYKDSSYKLWFRCKKCGYRWQASPNNIKEWYGCPKCGGSMKLTTEEVIEMARAVHGDKYQYHDPYEGMDKLWRIICPIHGEFFQKPRNHIYGKSGCLDCAAKSRADKLRFSPEEIVEMSRAIHGDKYDYDLESIDGMRKPMRIYCKIHGWFEQTPNHHIYDKCGCPDCWEAEHKNETNLYNYICKEFPQCTVVREWTSEWLTNNKRLDIRIIELHIGIEYQGFGHFGVKPIHDDTQEKYEKRCQYDLDKYRECQENGVKLFYFSHEKNLPSEYIDKIYTNEPELVEAIKKLAE